MNASESPASTGQEPGTAGPAFLAEASRLLADSLDYEATLSTVARLALPSLGAWCIVDVVEEDGAMRRLAVIHPDPARQTLARRLTNGWPPEADHPLGVPVVVRTRRAEMVPRVSEDMLAEAAPDEVNRRALRELGIGSLIVAPMVARGQVHGAMTFVSPRPGEYGPAELDLAEDLARRAAMAIDNARLYRNAERSRAGAEEASRAKSEFLATMSHELRTPINAVVGYVDLMELELAGPLTEGQREQLERIRAASAHLLSMVDEVLDLARVEAGQLPVARERALAQEAVDHALAAVRPQAEARGVSVAGGCAPAPPLWYVGDVRRVEQVVENLLSNAVKFSRPGGGVRVACGVTDQAPLEARLSGSGPWVAVEVEDAGMGIEPGDLAAVFEPFRQLDAGRTRTAGGSGLGLTVARQLARRMGGDVTLRSSPGVGSCATLWLPAAPDDAVPERRDDAERRRAAEALCAAGRILTVRVEEILEAYVRRLRADAGIPHAGESTDVDLMDHSATLLADLAQSLVVLGGRAEDAAELLRDGSRIQRLVAELHAEQRQRLGWSEDELRRDFCLLREEVEHCLRSHLRGDSAEAAASTAGRLLRQGERISVHAFRVAAAHPAAAPPGG
ncbi:MAG TPA: HAMP domain-containing sensor histidine kinase [Longimicrobium sp.]|nr:HAMP domain-containing sensor histidine kinase [Longimicrobium sp.]